MTLPEMYTDLVIQNLKTVLAMKSCGYSDSEISKKIGLPLKDFLETIGNDPYLTENIKAAQGRVATEVEYKFLSVMEEKLADGDTNDAKWFLEKTTKKYAKRETVEVNVKTIDDIIREKSETSGKE